MTGKKLNRTGLHFVCLMVALATLLAQDHVWSADGTWSPAPVPAGTFRWVSSSSAGPGNWSPKWIGLWKSTGEIYVSPTPPTSSSWVQYGSMPSSSGTIGYMAFSNTGMPVVSFYTSSPTTMKVYYWDTATTSWQLSYIPSFTSPGNNDNNVAYFWTGALGNDINGNITYMKGTWYWSSTDAGKTFTQSADLNNFLEPPAPNFDAASQGMVVGPLYGTNASTLKPSGVHFDHSTAPWGEIFYGSETTIDWHSYDNGVNWEPVDPLFHQVVRDNAGVPLYRNFAVSFFNFSGNNGAPGYTTDGDAMLCAGKVSYYAHSSLPRFWRFTPMGQILDANNGDLDPDPAVSPYAANGYFFSYLSSHRGHTTQSGDTYMQVKWNVIPTGNPLNRNLTETVKWDADLHQWKIISPTAGTAPSTLLSNYNAAATDGQKYYMYSLGGGTSVYQWTPNAAANNRPLITLKPTALSLTVNTDPTTHIASATPASCFNVSDDLTPIANLNYTWSYRGQGTVVFDNPFSANPTAYFSNPGYYVLNLAANDGSKTGSMSVIVKVLAPTGGSAPVVTSQPQNKVMTIGSPVTVSVAATGSNLVYRWKRNGEDVVNTDATNNFVLQSQTLSYSGASTNTLTITAARSVDELATYYCEISNPWGRVVSSCATLGIAPTILQGPVNNILANGDLTVAANGTQPITWQWYDSSNTAISGANQSLYHATATGSYHCIVSNIFGSATTAPATITNTTGNSVTLNFYLGGNGTMASTGKFLVGTTIGVGTEYCSGSDWLLFTSWSTSNSSLVSTTTPNAYQAKFTIAAGATGQTVSINAGRADFVGNYPLTVRNGWGTSFTNPFRFHTGDKVVIEAMTAPAGMHFAGWVGSGTGALNSTSTSPATVTMPAGPVDVTASYVSNAGTHTVSGTITLSAAGLSGVTVSDGTRSAVTNGAGQYTISSVPDGSYTLTPTLAGYTFSPVTLSVTIAGANLTGKDFTASAANQAPVISSAAWATPNPVVNAFTTSVNVGAYDPDNGPAALTYTWSKVSGPGAVNFAPNGTTASDISTATFAVSGTYTLQVNVFDGAATVSSQIVNLMVTIPNNAPTVTTAASATPNSVTGTTTVLSVLGTDDTGEPALTYTWSATGPASVSYSANGTNAAKNATATFTAAGSYTVTATITDVGGLTATSNVGVTVNQTLTTVTVAPATASVLVSGTQSFTASGVDQFGTAMAASYTWTVGGGGSISPAGLFTAGSTAGGPYTVTATSGSRSGTAQVTVTAAPVQYTLTVGSGTGSGQYLSGTVVAIAANTAPAGQIFDQWTGTGVAYVASATTSNTTLTMPASDISVTATYKAASSNPITVTFRQGVSGYVGTTDVTITNQYAASYNKFNGVTYLTGDLASSNTSYQSEAIVQFNSLGIPSSATVTSATLTLVATTWQTNNVSGFYLNKAWNPTVTGTNDFGWTTRDVNVPWTVAGAQGSGTDLIAGKSFAVPLTASGVQTKTMTLDTSVVQGWVSNASSNYGVILINAQAGGQSTIYSSENSTVNNRPLLTIIYTNGPPNNAPTVVTAASATPNPVVGTTTALSVLGADDAGEPALSYTWSATGPASVSYSANGSNAAKNATATFTTAGSYTLTATITDGGGLTVTSNVGVTVNHTLTTVTVAPSSASVQANNTQSFTASGVDQFGAAMTATYTWTVGGGSINAAGLFTAGSTAGGPYTVTATSGSASGTAQVTVTEAPTVATAASATPNPVAGTTTALSVLGADDAGEPALSYTWSATGPASVAYSVNGSNAAKNATATFTAAGSYTLTATITDGGGLTVTSNVGVTVNQTLTTVTVTPSSASVQVNNTQSFSASGVDQFGAAMTATYTWTVGGGSINAAGLFTAGSTAGGPYTVTATSGSRSGTAQVTVTAAPVQYTLTVGSGTGSGQYLSGTVVAIAANTAPAGQIFDQWTGTGVAYVASATTSNTTLTMPASDISVTATYKAASSNPVTVTFQQGVNGYVGTTDVTITNQYAASYNKFNGVTYLTGDMMCNNTTSYQAEAILQFNSLGIPASATVTSATLTLVANTWQTNNISGFYLNKTWNPTVTGTNDFGWTTRDVNVPWTVAGAQGSGTDLIAGKSFAVPLTASGVQTKTLTLDTSVVQGWVNNASSNHGVILINAQTGGQSTVCSSENSTVANRPVLTITYTP